MKKINFISISSQFGHEIMALNFAHALGLEVVIIPNKEEPQEFEEESKKIYDNMSFFYRRIFTISYKDRQFYEEMSRDIIGELKAGTLPNDLWKEFAESELRPSPFFGNLPEFYELYDGKPNILVVPQKLLSDNACGVTAAQQSVNPAVFNFLKGLPFRLVLGQHFNKVSDLETVKALQQEFNFYVPGMTEDQEVFGIRGVRHVKYYNMYGSLSASVGIAGTHTWYLLTMFPDIPQIILYNKNGVEHWEAIAQAYRKAGYNIWAIGFDETTDMTDLSKEIETRLFGIA